MYDYSLLALSFGLIVEGLFIGWLSMRKLGEQIRDSHTERTALCPAAVGEGWVVGGWGVEMPLFICRVEAGTVPVYLESVFF